MCGFSPTIVTAIAQPHRGQIAPQTIGVRSPIGLRDAEGAVAAGR